MGFTSVGGVIEAASNSETITPSAVGNIFVLIVAGWGAASEATSVSVTGGNCTWQQLGGLFYNNVFGTPTTATFAVFLGTATSTGAAAVTATFNGVTETTYRIVAKQFSVTGGQVFIDGSLGTVDYQAPGSNAEPALLPSAAGDLYVGYDFDINSASSGSTSGYTYAVDGNGNGLCWNTNCGSGSQQPTWASSTMGAGVAVLLKIINTTTPVLAGSFSAAAGGSLTPACPITTSIPDGDTIKVGVLATAGTVSAPTDTKGNTYTLVGSDTTNAGSQVYNFECAGASGLTAGIDTITPTYSSSSSVQGILVVDVPGVSGVDVAVNNHGTGTTASVPTGTLGQAEEVIISFIVDLAAGGVPTLGGGLTALGHVEGGTVSYITAGYAIVNSTGTTTPSATITSTTWAISTTTEKVNPVTILTASVPNGVLDIPYSTSLVAAGGVAPYTFTLASGSLPTGVTLASNGLLSGSPEVTGTFTFTIQVSDAHSVTGNATFQLVVSSLNTIDYLPRPNNLLSADDADFENSITGTWAGVTGVNGVAVTDRIAFTGAQCMTWVLNSSTGIVATGYYPVIAGAPYIASGVLFAPRTSDTIISFLWYDNTHALIGESDSQVWAAQGVGYFSPVTVMAPAPSNAAYAKIQVSVNGVAGDVWCADYFTLLQTDVAVLIDFVAPAWSPGSAAGNFFLDCSAWVRMDQGFTISRGRTDAISEIQPGSCTFELQNDLGYFTQGAADCLPPQLGGTIDLQYRTQVSFADETGAWWTRFDGPIAEIDYAGDAPGLTNIATVLLSDVMSFMNRADSLGCWTEMQILSDLPAYHWALNDSGNAGNAGLAAETSGNNGPPMRTFNSDSSGNATISWQDSSSGIETLADAVKPGVADGSEYWSAGSTQPTSAIRGLDSGGVGPFSTPSPNVYMVPHTTADSTSYNQFSGTVGYSLGATVPVISPNATGKDFAAEMWFTCDPSILANKATKVGPYCQLTLVNSKTARAVVAGIFLSGSSVMNYEVALYGQPPAFSRQNFSTAGVATPTASISKSFTPDAVPLPHHLVLNVQGDPVTPVLTAYLDGQVIGTLNLATNQNFDTIMVGAAYGGTGAHAGGLSMCSIYPYQLTQTQITTHCQLGQYGMWEETSDDCIAALGVYSGIPTFWNNLQAQNLGLALMEYQDITGTNALSSMQLFEQAEMGLLYINAAGQLSYNPRNHRMGKGSPDLYLPPDTYTPGLGMILSDQFQVNEQAISSQLFQTGSAYINGPSQDQYGTYATAPVGSPTQLPLITWSRAYGQIGLPTFYYWSDPNLDDLASWIAQSRSQPWQFPTSLTIDVLTLDPFSGLTKSQLYALDINSLISPSGSLPASLPNGGLSVEWFIEGVQETKTNQSQTLLFYTSPAETQRAWKPGDEAYGVLGSTTRVGISQADTSIVQADGKDVSHDAGRPYWPGTFNAAGFLIGINADFDGGLGSWVDA